MTNLDKLITGFSTALGIEPSRVTDDLSYNAIAEWDSTAHMILIAQLEGDFQLMLDTDDIIDMSSFSQAKTILAKYEVDFS
ncbi:MAG: acyl carrier protein [Paraglaciecola sp.]|uniref:acyl carrier protein n=1 Tax=Paraglaciecola sp. TaxID=1920173 RepID=UPI00273F52E8|nr:acyl carrier protein [Paraglaciecola sp.]MDP5029280.1 acyl carrier protein [Paraglaciecola sp.]MDP5131091.1 acyl carrier protein [Paraglaciecola sp.]